MKRDYLFHSFFLAVFLFLLYQFGLIIGPFVTPILGAIVLLILVHPFHRALAALMPNRSSSFTAACSTILVTTLVVGPFLLVCSLLFNEAQTMRVAYPSWSDAVQGFRDHERWAKVEWIQRLETYLQRSFGVGPRDFQRYLTAVMGDVFMWITLVGKQLARNAVLSLFHLGIVVFTLFFLLRDGDKLYGMAKRLVPMRSEHKDRIAARLRQTVSGFVRGSILTAIFQTLCATIGYLIFSVPAAFTLGAATGLAAFIPVVGTALIWLPISLFLMAGGHFGQGIGVLLWGLVIVSTFDNVLRTLLIGKRAELPLLFVFFGILGGAQLYGLKGLLIGPLLVAVLPVFFDIYREQYLRKDLSDDLETIDDLS